MQPVDAEPRSEPAHSLVPRFVRTPWLAAAVGGLCFINTIGNEFTLDDRLIIPNNPRIRSLANFRQIWLTDWWRPQDARREIDDRQRDRLYRPLTMFTFALNYAVGGNHPGGYHAANIALHMLACWLVWSFARRLFADAGVATCAALMFAVHPIHCEAVANIVGRAELLAAVFLLLAANFLMPVSGRLGFGARLGATACFLAALMSKETAICFPFIAVIILLYCRPKNERRRPKWCITQAALLIVPLLVYFPLRYAALEQMLLRDRDPSVLSNTLYAATPAARVVMPFTIIGMYTRLTFAPTELSTDYGAGVLDATAAVGVLTVLGLGASAGLILALYGYRARSALWRRCAVLSAMIIASYALISNTFILIGVTAAERLVYWASAPVSVLAALLAANLWRSRFAPGRALGKYARSSMIVGAAFLATLGLRSVIRNTDWASNATLIAADVEAYPDGVIQNMRMGELLVTSGGPAEARLAIPFLEKTLAGYPRFPKVLYLLARAYVILGERPRAVEYLEATLEFDPANPDALWMLTAIQSRKRDVGARLEALRSAVTTRPSDESLYVELGGLLRGIGRRAESRAAYAKAAQLAPDDADIVNFFAEALVLSNEPQRARAAFARVIELDPARWQAHTNLSRFLADVDPLASLRHAREAQRLEPGVLQTNVNLAEALAVNGLVSDAIRMYRLIERGLAADDIERPIVSQRIEELLRERP